MLQQQSPIRAYRSVVPIENTTPPLNHVSRYADDLYAIRHANPRKLRSTTTDAVHLVPCVTNNPDAIFDKEQPIQFVPRVSSLSRALPLPLSDVMPMDESTATAEK